MTPFTRDEVEVLLEALRAYRNELHEERSHWMMEEKDFDAARGRAHRTGIERRMEEVEKLAQRFLAL